MGRSCWPVAIASMLASTARAVDGEFDPAWGNGGRLQVDVSPGSDEGQTLLIQRDGKLLLSGTCAGAALSSTFCAARLLPNGGYDATFGPTHLGYMTFLEFPGFPSGTLLRGAAPLPGGGNVFAGYTVEGYGLVARLADDGASVAHAQFRFNANSISLVSGVAVQPDGKIVVAGRTTRPGQTDPDFGVARLRTDLSLDPDFGNGGTQVIAFDLEGPTNGGSDVARAVALQADGRIVVAGAASNNTETYVAVARLTTNGQLDTSFAGTGRRTFSWSTNHVDQVHAAMVDRNGTILIAGNALIGIGAPDHDFAVSRLAPDGSFDPVFGLQCPPPTCASGTVTVDLGPSFGGATNDIAWTFAVQADGKIVVAGDSSNTTPDSQKRFSTVRLTRHGELDLGYGIGGVSGGSFANVWKLDSASAVAFGNGGLMIAGPSREAVGTNLRFGIGRLRLDLIFANGFNP